MSVPARELVRVCRDRSTAVVDALRSLSDDELHAPSALPDWSRLTIACHLRYGTSAVLAMTPRVLAGEEASYYPGGRTTQRPGTLSPDDGELPHDVVESFARASGELYAFWDTLSETDFNKQIKEPRDNVDLSPLNLYGLAVLRLTETDVHAIDFDLGLPDWSDELSEAGIPFRVGRLRLRPLPAGASGAWRLETTVGESYGAAVTDGVFNTDTRLGAATIRGTRRDIFALLMGRPFAGDVSGPVADFQAVFGGP